MKRIILVLLTAVLLSTALVLGAAAEETAVAKINYEIGQLEEFDNFCVTSIILVPDETNAVVINGKTVVDEEDVLWTEKYELTTEQYLELFKVNNSNLVYDAATAQVVPESAANVIIEAIQPAKMDVDIKFNGFGSEGLLRNIKYMGLGMLGIFVVVGVVMAITYILNSATSKKKA